MKKSKFTESQIVAVLAGPGGAARQAFSVARARRSIGFSIAAPAAKYM